MADKLFSESTEKALLGLLVSKPDLSKSVAGRLNVIDFYSKDNALVFEAIIRSLDFNGSSDEILVLEELTKISKKDKKYWVTYLLELSFEKGLESNIDKYVDLILEKKQARDLETTLIDSVKLIGEGGNSVSELIGHVETKIQDVTRKKELKDFSDVNTLTNEFTLKLKKMEEEGYQDGLRTKISVLDEKIGGLKGGQFVVVAARPSMGKTAFSLEIAKNIAMDKNVGFFSLEMPTDQLITRLISSESMIDSNLITRMSSLNQMAAQRVQFAIEKIKKLNLWIDDSPSLKIGELTWKARKLNSLHNLDMIIIDYLQLIESENKSGDNRQQVISDISRQLKSLSRELDVPVIALSQLSRRVEQREDKRPQMSDIRESGAIEQDADIIMFLYREDYYKQKDSTNEAPISELEVIISKHRNGATGIAHLGLDLKFGKISNISTTYRKEN